MGLLISQKGLDRADRTQLVISYLLQLILVAELIYSIIEQNWLLAFATVGILILTLLPGLIRRKYNVFLPVEFDLLAIIFIFAALFLGEVHSYYVKFWWWDVVLHTGSGLLLGLAGFLLVYVLNEEKKASIHLKPGFIALFALAFAIALGAVWEIFEFSMDSWFGLDMQKSGIIDTMWDLIVDSLGAAVVSVLGFFYIRQRKSWLFDRTIRRFIERNPGLFRRG